MLLYKPMKKSEKVYAIQLARNEIDIELKRLDQYKTYIIYNKSERIGFVSYGLRRDKTIYIYILAFEKHAQRQGFGSMVIKRLMKRGQKNDDSFKGLSVKVNKGNGQAINAVKKYGFVLTRKGAKYLDFFKPIS